MKLAGRNILLGVSGGIAAYKCAELVRLLKKSGADVQVVMTQAASAFVTPLTLQALSGRPVRTELFDTEQESAMGHIELARWADLILIAPATANFMAQLAHGSADDLLTTICVATEADIVVAPAMNQAMWANQVTRENAELLTSVGIAIWGPAEGEQACGETGEGRMLEPVEIHERLVDWLTQGPLQGKTVVLTAGPTQEPIDPVRYIGNRSSGKMGYELARAFAQAGAQVLLVSGPVSLQTPVGVKRYDVNTAAEMFEQVIQLIADCNIFVACAAVADYRVETVATQKLKKNDNAVTLQLRPNVDILTEVAALENAPFTLGFAAETQNLLENASEKRLRKGVDVIAANLVGGDEGGFVDDKNALTVLWDKGEKALPMMPKNKLANELVSLIMEIHE